jgi:nucleotide-binding universal stress UspA family protein
LQIRSVLVPLDGSPLAEQALPIAARIAERAKAKLRLVLVHQPTPPPIDRASAKLATSVELAVRKSERDYLRGLQARLRESTGRPVGGATLTGRVSTALLDQVRELGVDLVVMATHGRGGLQRAWLGSVADDLVRSLEVPVLLLRPGTATPTSPGAILVPLDGSPLAEQAIAPAVTMARLLGTGVAFAQVVQPVMIATDPMLPLPSAFDTEATARFRAQAQDYLHDLVEQSAEAGVHASAAADVGWNVVDTLLESARGQGVGMIAIATHGRGGVRRLALGSVADKLVRSADVPVLVIRPRPKTTKRR